MDIKKYANSYGIISNIDEFMDDLYNNCNNKEVLTILKEIILHNDSRYKEMNNDIDEFNKSQLQVSHVLQKEVLPDKKISVKTGINYNIGNYMDLLDKAVRENDLIILLNSITDDNIITFLKFKLLEYITMYKKEMITDKDNYDYYLSEISMLNYKLDYIINYEKIVKSDKIIDNNIIIPLDEQYFYDDLEKIDPSQYSSYNSMLSSIIIGTFVGRRSFFVSKGFNLYEVRNINGNRIVYDKISDNTYVIISLFDKNNDFTYVQKVINRLHDYNERIKHLKEQIQNNNFQVEQQNKVLSLLSSKKRGIHG